MVIEPPKFGIREIYWQPLSAVSVTQSIFTFKKQTYAWQGQMREVQAKLAPLTVEQGKQWKAFFYKLNGSEGTFYLSDTIGSKHHGNVRGLGFINGANQRGSTMVTDGWVGNVYELFKAGDMISVNDRIYDILEDAHSDANGNASLTVWPQLHGTLADNAEIRTNARGVFRMKDFPSHGWSENRLMEGVEFTATEEV